MKKILVLTTGGTIASRRGEPVTTAEVQDQLAQLVPQLECRVEPVCQLASSQLTMDVMWDLAGRIAQAPPDSGIVITHGTDTMEETAFFLDLVLGSSSRVVLTGSMRGADAPGFDGWANLSDACQAAARPELVDHGVTVLMGGELHAARHVTKAHSRQLHAFASPGAGPIARIIDGHCQWLWGPPSRSRAAFHEAVAPVELVTMAVDASPRLVQAAGGYARGLVVEGMGDGHVPPQVHKTLQTLAHQGLPVVTSTRCLEGGATKRAGPLVYTELPGPKARLLLMLALAKGPGWADCFAPYTL